MAIVRAPFVMWRRMLALTMKAMGSPSSCTVLGSMFAMRQASRRPFSTNATRAWVYAQSIDGYMQQ
jgi:hypothetical protein